MTPFECDTIIVNVETAAASSADPVAVSSRTTFVPDHTKVRAGFSALANGLVAPGRAGLKPPRERAGRQRAVRDWAIPMLATKKADELTRKHRHLRLEISELPLGVLALLAQRYWDDWSLHGRFSRLSGTERLRLRERPSRR